MSKYSYQSPMKKAMLGLGIAALAATTLYITYYLVNNDFDDRSSADSGNGSWGCFNEGSTTTASCTKTSQDKRGRKVTSKGTKTGYCGKITYADGRPYRLDWNWSSCK